LRRLPAASPFHGSGYPTGPRDLLEDGNAGLLVPVGVPLSGD